MSVQCIEIWIKLAIEIYLMSAEKVNNATIPLFAITATAVVTISILSIPTAMASILRINTPNQGQKVPAGSFLVVTGRNPYKM